MRRFWRIFLILSILIAIALLFRLRPATAPRKTDNEGGPVPVLVQAATRQDVPVYLDAIGTVQAFNTVQIRAMVDGPLTDIRFREGQDVHTGDILARIDPRPFQATLDQALGKKAQDEATLANARLDLARYRKLAATAYTSAQTADTQAATVAADEAIVRQDAAQIDADRVQLGYATITAPIDGRTGIRQVDMGNIVHAADTTPLVVLTQLRPISVVFTLPQTDLPAIQSAIAAGTPAVSASSQTGPGVREVLDTGTLTVLDNQIDAATGTARLKATFPNATLRLWPGGFVGARLLVRTERNALTVPPAAVQRGPAGDYVFVVAADHTAHRRAVTIGVQDAAVAVVDTGLDAGAQVVIDGAARLTDGAAVRLP